MIKSEKISSGVVAASNRQMSEKTLRTIRQLPLHVGLGFLLLLVSFPFIWMILTAFKPDFQANPASLQGGDRSICRLFDVIWPKQWEPVNFADAWTNRFDSNAPAKSVIDAPFTKYFFNSIVAGVAVTMLVIITSCLAAYAFARMDFYGKKILFALILATLAIPNEANLIPNLVIISNMNLANTYWALILPFSASAFYIFLLRQYFLGLPQELYEAGQLDGMTDLGYLWRVAIPLSLPAILTTGLFSFMGSWNSVFWPLIATPDIKVVQIGIRDFISNGETQTQWNLLMAGSLIVILPIVVIYFLVQRRFIEGIARTGIK